MLICGCASRSPSAISVPVSDTGLYFDTVVTITLYEYDGSSDEIFKACMDMCAYYESLFSDTMEGTDVWRINHAADDSAYAVAYDGNRDAIGNVESDKGIAVTVQVSEETAELIRAALKYCELSNGALDLTVGGLSSLWDIKGNSASDIPRVPAEADIKEALSHVDYRNVSVDTDNDGISYVTLSDPYADITLGFIAKGYIADKLDEYLRGTGVTSAMINLGGNIKLIGSKPDGESFKIGIQKPFDLQGVPITTVSVSDCSVVSSGIYERYFTIDDHIYHHILDTSTGYPTEGVLGTTIIAPTSVDADAMSTLCMLVGADEGLAIVESMDDTEIMYIADDYSMLTSSGWSAFTR